MSVEGSKVYQLVSTPNIAAYTSRLIHYTQDVTGEVTNTRIRHWPYSLISFTPAIQRVRPGIDQNT